MSKIDESDEPTVLLSDEYDSSADDLISVRIARLVASASDRNALDLAPLGEAIDAHALDALITPSSISDPDVEFHVSFQYEGYTVEIDSDGTVNLLGHAT